MRIFRAAPDCLLFPTEASNRQHLIRVSAGPLIEPPSPLV